MKYFLLTKKQNEKLRNPNIDIIRIFGMLAIVIHHLLWHGKILIKYKEYKELQLLNIMCMWHVSSFGIISGLVGGNSHKYSNLFYLWIESIFYCMIFFILYNENKTSIFHDKLISNIFIVIYKKYWYITSYFGIYPFLIFIKVGISNLSRIIIKKSLYYIIGLLIMWSSFSNDCFGQFNGKSPLSLLIFYIIGVYIAKYIFRRNNNMFHRLLIYIISFLIFLITSFICYKINYMNAYLNKSIKMKKLFRVELNSFPMLMQVFCVIIFISQISFNVFFSNVITFIAPLIFDVYLIHENPYIRNRYIMNNFNEKPNNINLVYFIL